MCTFKDNRATLQL